MFKYIYCSLLLSSYNLRKPSKNNFCESWDLVPAPPAPSLSYQGWYVYQKIKLYVQKKRKKRSEHVIFLCRLNVPPSLDNVLPFIEYIFLKASLNKYSCTHNIITKLTIAGLLAFLQKEPGCLYHFTRNFTTSTSFSLNTIHSAIQDQFKYHS